MEWKDFLKRMNKLVTGSIIYVSDFEENQRENVRKYLTLLNRLGFVSQMGSDDPLMDKLEAYTKNKVLPNLSFEELEDDLDALDYLNDYEVLTGNGHVESLDRLFCNCLSCENPEKCYGRRLQTGRIIREITRTLQNSPK